MSYRFLKVQTFVVAAALSITMLLFAAQHHTFAPEPEYRAVVDLSHSRTTMLIAPAKLGGGWTVDALPPSRLIAPLAVIEAQHKNFPDLESLVTMDDVASYEPTHGAVSQGAIILLTSKRKNATPVFDHDALHFLVEARSVVGIGSAGTQVASADENSYLANKGIYELESVANVSFVPATGVIAIAAPQKIDGAVEGPVRLMALVR